MVTTFTLKQFWTENVDKFYILISAACFFFRLSRESCLWKKRKWFRVCNFSWYQIRENSFNTYSIHKRKRTNRLIKLIYLSCNHTRIESIRVGIRDVFIVNRCRCLNAIWSVDKSFNSICEVVYVKITSMPILLVRFFILKSFSLVYVHSEKA